MFLFKSNVFCTVFSERFMGRVSLGDKKNRHCDEGNKPKAFVPSTASLICNDLFPS